MQYTDIKTYEDACKAMGTTPEADLPYANPGTAKQEALNGFAMADTFTAAINDDPNFPDYNNRNQAKWEIWWDLSDNKSGFGFSHSRYDYWSTYTTVGSRLVFNSREKAIYAANTIPDIYKKFIKK